MTRWTWSTYYGQHAPHKGETMGHYLMLDGEYVAFALWDGEPDDVRQELDFVCGVLNSLAPVGVAA